MVDETDPPVTREELIEARDVVRKQLEVLETPVRGRDRSPQLIAKLQGMLNDINDALADLGTDNA